MLATRLHDAPSRAKSPRRTVAALRAPIVAKAAEAERLLDASLPPDEPPGFPEPGPYVRPAVVEVSAKLIKGLRADYGPRVATDEGRRIGDLAEVREWLGQLQPGKVRPRAES